MKTNGKKVLFRIITFMVLFVIYEVHASFSAELKIPESHPIQLTEKPRCTACHPDDTVVALKPIGTFIHSSDWYKRHSFVAPQITKLCNICHKVSFCTDCHAYKDELKPSDKYSASAERWLPHRGDYLIQHRVDGRIDPTGCFRCHGRQNNRSCKRCHR